MTLDEAIVHATDRFMQMGCTECGKEHMQLANWLKELKDYRAFVSEMHDWLERSFRDYGADYQMHNAIADKFVEFMNDKKHDD